MENERLSNIENMIFVFEEMREYMEDTIEFISAHLYDEYEKEQKRVKPRVAAASDSNGGRCYQPSK